MTLQYQAIMLTERDFMRLCRLNVILWTLTRQLTAHDSDQLERLSYFGHCRHTLVFTICVTQLFHPPPPPPPVYRFICQ